MNSLIIINEKRRKIEMKKAISLVLALVLAVTAAGAVVSADSKSYSDLDENAWYAYFVGDCTANGWIDGFADGTFKPKQSMTRAEFITALFRLNADEKYSDIAENYYWYFYEWPFTDVSEEADYASAVLWGKVEGIIKGTGKGKFSPDSPLTREQAATIFYRYAAAKLYSNQDGLREFPDSSDISSWAKEAVKWMQGLNLLSGDENGKFNPKRSLSRAECAKLVSLLNEAMQPDAAGSGSVRELTAGFTQSVEPGKLAEVTDADREAILSFCAAIARENLGAEQSNVISPVSILYALGMLTSGAKGETLEQLEKAIGVPADVLNAYLYNFGKSLYGGGDTVQLADSIWINDENKFDCNPEYLQALADFYGAEAFSGKFDPELCSELNRWVYEKTYGMIKKTLDEVDPEAALYLVNTLALQLRWGEEYYRTFDGTFTRADGEKEDVQMLRGTEGCYLHDADSVGFMKYYQYGYRFVALLPDEGVSMDDYLKSLTGEKISKLLSGAKFGCDVHTMMPEFKTDSYFKLIEPLQKLGVTDVFVPFASNLKGIAEDADLYVSDIFQKAHIELDKDGTKAAAVTVIGMKDATAIFEEPKEEYYVYLDRPFVYMILDPSGELPLFIGVVNSVA